MSLTSQVRLRELILAFLVQAGGGARRADVLAGVDSLNRSAWTSDDLRAPASRPFESNWRNRASFERQRMVDLGLLERRADGNWVLTSAGTSLAQRGGATDWRAAESKRRELLWTSLLARGGPADVPAGLIRELGIFSGGRGVYANQELTKSAWAISGAAVSFLHLGHAYADEISSTGIGYHYPTTAKPGRDEAEIASMRSAFEAALPVFVIENGSKGATRTVHRGYIEQLNEVLKVALVTFANDGELPPVPALDHENPFVLVEADAEWTLQRRRARPNQARFAFEVLARYGAKCAVCDVDSVEVMQAAHLRPKASNGSDDPRNGIALCANHHLLFDRLIWGIEPASHRIVLAPGSRSYESLGIAYSNLAHLSMPPHEDAVIDSWSRWQKQHSR
ncbi:HNH endonuclease [Leifsonia aquatica]|uniref:HNH nuclease domain-containing protein n=2 Tax=Leifsonia aquatica TaxID=144185 RepID=U2RNQ8_LEIAQ|nr:HNH endonuclease [Leifsonia aquatica]ERK70446.1 hypothetical protein N136_03207 [Leifsonia aquatica ATCC 14665]MBB2967213.1 hypothetical protein [Leifsonia aquatica]